jgi:hypothetical protein
MKVLATLRWMAMPADRPTRPEALEERCRHDAVLPPGACSMAPRVAPCEAGLRYSLEKVDLAATTTEDGAGYTRRGAAECVMGKA